MKKAIQVKGSLWEEMDSVIHHEQGESLRLNKYISSSGFCSRREADRYIEDGLVAIDGVVAELGTRVFEHQLVQVKGHMIKHEQRLVYIALHKPIGITCTTDRKIQGNIASFMDYKDTIFPIGRLDKESSGLILLTNDGDIVNKILRSSNHHEKEYVVSVNRKIEDEFLLELAKGVSIYNPVSNQYQVTKPALVEKAGANTFHITLCEGLNRQIRRMCTALDYQVNTLKRIRVMNICLEDLPVGYWRYLSEEEQRTLNTLIQKQTSSE